MLFEHLIYSTAIAIIAGMLWYKRTGRDPSWIIIASSYAPDFDIIAGELFKELDMNILSAPIRHGDFHNIAFLLLFACMAALVLRLAGMRFWDSFLFAGIGFGAHMFEDALIANPAYAFFWPLSDIELGIGEFDYRPDLYGIANIDVLIVGVILIVLCGCLRAFHEGTGGIRKIARTVGIMTVIMILMVPVFNIIDMRVAENTFFNNKNCYIYKWSFTQNASWDSNVFHSGKHSAKIGVQKNMNNGLEGWNSGWIPIIPNKRYIFSSWGKTNGTDENSSPVVGLWEVNDYRKGLNQTRLIFGKGTNDWMRKQAIFTTLNNSSRIYVYANIGNGNGTFWFDDIELYEEGTENNKIPNSGFEENFKSILIHSIYKI